MAKKTSSTGTVKKETMYIAIGVALVVGFLGGIIFSSVQGDSYSPVARQQAPPPGAPQGGGGMSPEQASQILALEQRVASNPSDVAAWTQLGNTYFDANRADKAIRAYNKSLELRPGDPNVLTDLGVMYRRNNQPAEAIKAFEAAFAANPSHEVSRFNKGIVLFYDMGDVNGAIAAWEELQKMNPNAVVANGTPIAQFIDDMKKQAGMP